MNDQEDFLDSINFEKTLKEFDKLYNDLKRAKENEERYRQSATDMGFSSQFYRLSEELGDCLHWFDSKRKLSEVEEKYPDILDVLRPHEPPRPLTKITKRKQYELKLTEYIDQGNADPTEVKNELWLNKKWTNPSKYLDQGLADIGKNRAELQEISGFEWVPIINQY